jgi:hypothetical protein
MVIMGNNHKTPPQGESGSGKGEHLRPIELELWDRILERWNKHIARQIKITASVVSFVIVVAGFLGIRSLDSMVEQEIRESVRPEVLRVTNEIQARIDEDTGRFTETLRDQLFKSSVSLTEMTNNVAEMEATAAKAEKLIARMEGYSTRFGEIESDLHGRMDELTDTVATTGDELIASVEGYRKRFSGIESDVYGRVDKLGTTERELSARMESITDEIALLERSASVALETAPSQGRGEATSVVELSAANLDAIGVRQVPTPLGEASGQSGRRSYLLTFSVFVADAVPRGEVQALLDSIQMVTYTLAERWFNPNVFARTNRKDNFQFSVTVWGNTEVQARAEFIRGASPVCWEGWMKLDGETTLSQVPCG